MRFASYRHPSSGTDARLGLVVDDQVIDLTDLYADLLTLIDAGEAGLDAVRAHADSGKGASVALAEVQLLAPIPNPHRDLFAVGLNYEDHFREGDLGQHGIVELPKYPSFFVKATGTVIGPDEPIGYAPYLSTQWDYEAELVAIIGRRGRDIPRAEALDHVFGYTLANDVSVRDIQRRHGQQWNKGKSIDRTCPLGPIVITPDELDGTDHIQAFVNGEKRQDCSLELMVFPVAEIVASLSEGTTIHPGDIILTGTPAGVGYAQDPPSYLAPGDEVVVRLDSIGELRNVVGTDLGPLRER
jgi:2,4-diketo-3-deoxy-L-fuconate hydrolase